MEGVVDPGNVGQLGSSWFALAEPDAVGRIGSRWGSARRAGL